MIEITIIDMMMIEVHDNDREEDDNDLIVSRQIYLTITISGE